jgi:hypothetical protein
MLLLATVLLAAAATTACHCRPAATAVATPSLRVILTLQVRMNALLAPAAAWFMAQWVSDGVHPWGWVRTVPGRLTLAGM